MRIENKKQLLEKISKMIKFDIDEKVIQTIYKEIKYITGISIGTDFNNSKIIIYYKISDEKYIDKPITEEDDKKYITTVTQSELIKYTDENWKIIQDYLNMCKKYNAYALDK